MPYSRSSLRFQVRENTKKLYFSSTKFGLSLTTKTTIYQWSSSWDLFRKITALDGNLTRVNCLGISYAHHYTTNADIWRYINDNWQHKFTKFSYERNNYNFTLHEQGLDCPWPLKPPIINSPVPENCIRSTLHWPGIEPGSTAWEAAMLTTIPPTL